MRAIMRHLLAGVLLWPSWGAWACPICLGWGRPSAAQRLVISQQAVLAVPTAAPGRFRAVQIIKGERPAMDIVDGGYPRNSPVTGDARPTSGRPLLLVRDDPLPTWVILGEIDDAHADWLRALAAGKPVTDLSPEEWRARVALVIPHLNDPEPLAAELASTELAAAPYAALRTLKPHLDASALRQCLADPALAARHPLSEILLGIAGDVQDAATLEQRLQAAAQAGDAANLSAMLAADLELGGAARVEWIEATYLADPRRSAPELKAALLTLSVHGHAASVISRERVIQAYRVFMKAHPEIAGDVALDLAAWQYWDAVPDYLALMKSGVRQQYPSRRAGLAYLELSPNARALGFSPEAVPGDVQVRSQKPSLP